MCSLRIYTLFLSESLDLIKDTAEVKQRARHPCLAPASFPICYYCAASQLANAQFIDLTSSSGLLYLRLFFSPYAAPQLQELFLLHF